MKKKKMSKSVSVGLTAALATVILSGCDDSKSTRVCVDSKQSVVDDALCKDNGDGRSGDWEDQKDEQGNHIRVHRPFFRWYYPNMGSGRAVATYPIGSHVTSGSWVAPEVGSIVSRSGSIVRSGGIARGGFGASAGAHGGGG